MINYCQKCNKSSLNKEIDKKVGFVVCPYCGHKTPFLLKPLFILLGASGTGKSTIYQQLLQNTPECVILESDFLIDSIGKLIPNGIWSILKWFSKLALPNKKNVSKRKQEKFKEPPSLVRSLNQRFVYSYRNIWLRIAKNIHQSGRSVVLLVRATPDHFEACPERSYFSAIHYAALVCSEDELTKRIANRYPDIIDHMIALNHWFQTQAETHSPPIQLIDTTDKSPEETSYDVAHWIRQHLGHN